jgi:hypothetical protein
MQSSAWRIRRRLLPVNEQRPQRSQAAAQIPAFQSLKRMAIASPQTALSKYLAVGVKLAVMRCDPNRCAAQQYFDHLGADDSAAQLASQTGGRPPTRSDIHLREIQVTQMRAPRRQPHREGSDLTELVHLIVHVEIVVEAHPRRREDEPGRAETNGTGRDRPDAALASAAEEQASHV